MDRSLLVVASVLGLGSCSHSPPAPELPYPRAEVPFFMSSLSTAYAVRGEFGGSTLVTPTSIEVRVDSTTVRRPTNRARVSATIWVRAVLAVQTPQSWRIISRSQALVIADASPGGTSLTPPLRFSIPKPRGFDLAKNYLSFEFAFDSREPGMAPKPATTYTCGAAGMLQSPAVITHTHEDAC